MRRSILSLILGVILVLVMPAFAFDPLKDIKVGGEFRVRGLSTNNLTDWKDTKDIAAQDDLDDHVVTRTRVSLSANIVEDVEGSVLIEHNPDEMAEKWATNGIHSVNDVEGKVYVRRACLKVKNIAELVDLTVGKQEYGKQYQEWIIYVDKLDAAKIEASLGPVDITALGAKMEESEDIKDPADIDKDGNIDEADGIPDYLQGFGRNRDTDLYGLSIMTSTPLPNSKICGYFYNSIENRSIKDNIGNNTILGVKLEGEIPMASKINYLAEVAMQTGDEPGVAGRDLQGMGFRISGGYETSMADIGDIGLSLVYIYGSGDNAGTTDKNEAFTGISPVFSVIPIDRVEYTTVLYDYDRMNDLNNISNRGIVAVNANFTPAFFNKLNTGLTWANYTKNEVAAGAKDDIGSEIDLTATYIHSDKVSLGLMYGIFNPGDATVVDGDPASKFMTEVKIAF
ncbi:MAG: alginate export family protein [bacterium]|nr:alginate export family protein [bacterium]